MKEKIIQFGEGNFLRGFADYFVHILNEKGLYDGNVVVVQPIKTGLTDVINSQEGTYNLYLRGLENGEQKCERTEIHSISRAIDPYKDFESYLALADKPDMRFIISNTTEAGIVFDPSNLSTDKPPDSFPGKLTLLLYRRFRKGLPGFVILCCELVDNNADLLKKCVLSYADCWQLGEDFFNWVIQENTFCNTLVDRIVTGFPKSEAEELCCELGWDDQLLDTAELFHLWVIEGDFEKELPLKSAGLNVVWTQDASPFKKRKVRLLNGAHTSMVCAGLLAGIETVGDCMKDKLMRSYLERCIFKEILPVLGDNEENQAFAKAVIERFENPYIQHQLNSIVLNCVSKFAVRVLPTILEFHKQTGDYPKGLVFSLAALIAFYKKGKPNDLADVQDFMKNMSLEAILKNSNMWGEDLEPLIPLVEAEMKRIDENGIQEAIQWNL